MERRSRKRFPKRDRNTHSVSSPKITFKEDEAWETPPRPDIGVAIPSGKRLLLTYLFPGPWPTMERQDTRRSTASVYLVKVGQSSQFLPCRKLFYIFWAWKPKTYAALGTQPPVTPSQGPGRSPRNCPDSRYISAIFNCYRGLLAYTSWLLW